MDIKISKTDFLNVYNNYKPNSYVKFMYKYFAASMKCKGTLILSIYIIIMNIICIFIDNHNNRSEYLLPMMFIANIPFFIWGILSVIAFSLNQSRHRKIMKFLEIDKREDYNEYIELYVKK